MPVQKDDLFLIHELVLPRKVRRLKHESDLNALKTIADWTRDFVASEHHSKEVGRVGPVCPFVPRAIGEETLWFAVEHVNDQSTIRVAQLMQEYKRLFLSIEPKEIDGVGKADYKTILTNGASFSQTI
jgi:hypothetical protein